MKPYFLKLPSALDECPRYWIEFIRNEGNPTHESTCEEINQVLAKYNARWVDFNLDVEFETEEYFEWFRVKWLL